jgi:hypothetical protein
MKIDLSFSDDIFDAPSGCPQATVAVIAPFFSRGYSTAEAVGLRGAALGAGRLAASCPIARKGQRSFFVKITFFNTTFFILILFCFV